MCFYLHGIFLLLFFALLSITCLVPPPLSLCARVELSVKRLGGGGVRLGVLHPRRAARIHPTLFNIHWQLWKDLFVCAPSVPLPSISDLILQCLCVLLSAL